jgi:outer membrane protein assembly factor BamB
MKTKNLCRLIGLVSLGLLAAYGVGSILGASRYKKWVFDAGESVDCASKLCKKVYALNARTGQIQWSLSCGWLTRDFIPGYGEDISLTIGPNGTVYAASSNGTIYALHSP